MRKISLAILVCISCSIATLMAEPLKIDGLTCENLKTPLAIDNTQPHFSWLNHATYNNARQTAYELQVGTDSVRLLHGKADCWQVCKQTSTSVMVPYGGKQLLSGHLYYWRVRSWNDKGEVSDWSEILPFGIGLLHTTDMRGKYIGMPLSEVACTSPIVRKIVYISPDKHKRLLLHVNSLGYHEVYVNGKKAGIHNAFFHATDTTYATGSPLDMAYPLLVGAVPASLHSAVVQRIIASCYGRFNGHIAGGLVGTAIFTQWAILQGQSQPEPSQLVYNMLKQRSYPGYLYMIDNNATTTWEYWNGERSHVHNCYNGIGLWFYQALGGIRPTDDGVGYQRVIIAPQCPKEVTWATTTRQTPYGLLRTEWRGSQLKAQIPVGVVAEVVWRGKRHIVGSGEWTF